jgi:O-antigen/teichoic acid export membrane protein
MAALASLLRQPLIRRVIASTGSNAYAQAVTITIQLVSLPLFLSRWDVVTYGHWIALSAVPAYLAMADVGMVTAAGNRMTMLMGEGNTRLANQVFQSALAFVLTVCSGAMLLVLAAAALWPGDAASFSARAAVLLLSAAVFAALVGGLPEAIYKATHRYALGAALANTTRLIEWLGALAGLWWFGDFVAVALGALIARAACTLFMIVHSARSTPAFRWGFNDASRAEIRHCAAPAISFMAFPVANALNFQGMTLVVATVLGPTATVIFNTYRTIARVTVQATATFSLALWPEFSRFFGQGNRAALARLYSRSRWMGWALAAGGSAVVYVAAPVVLNVWAKGQIAFSAPLMLMAMAYAATAGGWHVLRVLLLSTNEHSGLAWPFLAASAICVPLAWAMAQYAGLMGVMAVMLGLEVAMWLLCSRLSRRLLAPATAPHVLGAAT